MSEFAIRQHGTGVRFDVKVLPRSSTNQIGGLRDGRLIIRITAPPVDGAGNDAVVEVLAERLKVPRRLVAIVSGQTRRQKTVEVAGQRPDAVRARLLNERG